MLDAFSYFKADSIIEFSLPQQKANRYDATFTAFTDIRKNFKK